MTIRWKRYSNLFYTVLAMYNTCVAAANVVDMA